MHRLRHRLLGPTVTVLPASFKPGLHCRKQFKDPSHLVKRKSWPWVGDLLDEVVRVGSVARKELESWRTRCCHEEMSSLNLKCIFVPQG